MLSVAGHAITAQLLVHQYNVAVCVKAPAADNRVHRVPWTNEVVVSQVAVTDQWPMMQH